MSPYRSTFHANFRSAIGDKILIPAIIDEGRINVGAETAGDLIRGARTSLCRMDVTDEEVFFQPVCEYLILCLICQFFGSINLRCPTCFFCPSAYRVARARLTITDESCCVLPFIVHALIYAT